jgi:EAL domain-containing protein (putative c-di-GMP-specific phosphodiesterase class I)/DNA-binding NarL/FixJ family response regulator
MNDRLRVLVVDDSEDDAALIERALGGAGRHPVMRRVYDEPTMQAALDAGSWDVVLCDSGISGFGASTALGLIAQRGLEVPWIAVSGSMEPSAADDAIRLGARAYVRKDQLARLPPAIERELRRADGPAKEAGAAEHPRVLVVDDEPALLRGYKTALTRQGCVVDVAPSARRALELLASSTFDVIVSDLHMPEMNGLEFLRAVRQLDLDIPVILMTGQPGLDSAMRALEYGAFRYLAKPVDIQTLDGVVRRAARLRGLARLKRQAFELDGVADQTPGDRAGLEARFASALEKLWMAYQPIVSWRERRVFGYEALVRTTEPTLRNPAELLDTAERLGRLRDLGRLIRGRVAADAPGVAPGVYLFVNLHSADLNDDELYDAHAPLSRLAERVVLEITERASLDDVRGVEQRMEQLRARKFRVAIDDLGAGYAGLSSFTLLDPTIVKLDMSLIRNIDVDRRKQRIVEAMVRLCGDLAMQVVAEGVEQPSERDVLVGLGCDLLQGYLFARPDAGFPIPRW